MEQISSLLAAAAVGGFAITAVAGKFMIPALHRLHFGQTIREEGPTWHSKKNGTPTMGGLCFILGILATLGIVWVMYSPKLPEVLGMPQLQAGMLVLFLAFGSGLIGFLDDFIKVVKHRNLGLTEAQKMILQIALTFGFMFGLHSLGLLTTQVQFPIFGLVDMGLLYYPIAFFGIIFLVNAVNLTDGLDGLAIMPTVFVAAGFALVAWATGNMNFANYLHIPYLRHAGELVIVCTAIVGAGLGFPWFNTYPPQVLMCHVGSLALGGALGIIAVLLRQEFLLVIMGGGFVVETLSVILQVGSFKLRGQRIFRMAPIHHHYELKGWPEPRVIVRFWIISLMLVLIGLATLKVR